MSPTSWAFVVSAPLKLMIHSSLLTSLFIKLWYELLLLTCGINFCFANHRATSLLKTKRPRLLLIVNVWIGTVLRERALRKAPADGNPSAEYIASPNNKAPELRYKLASISIANSLTCSAIKSSLIRSLLLSQNHSDV